MKDLNFSFLKIVTLLVGLWSSITIAVPRCEDLFLNENSIITPYSKEWLRLSVRDPNQQLLDTGYPKRLFDSIHEVFAPWFENQDLFGDLPFTEILRMEHIYLVTGKNDDERYHGATLPANGLKESYIHEGQFLFEGYRSTHLEGHSMSYRMSAKLPPFQSDHLRWLVGTYETNLPENKISEPNRDFAVEPLHSVYSAKDSIRLPRVKDHIKIWNEVFSDYITHHYPSPKDQQILIKYLEEIMLDIRHLTVLKKNGKSIPNFNSQIIYLISEYLYLGIHIHLFEAGNFSLIMSQINYILMQNGINGISHGSLDYVGLSEQFDFFKKYFIELVKLQNPDKAKQFRILNNFNLKRPRTQISRRSIPLNITAHISKFGDALFQENMLIESPRGNRDPIEGLYIQPQILLGDVKLQYSGIDQANFQFPWINTGGFLGSSGQNKGLNRIALRLIGDRHDEFEIRYRVRIGKKTWSKWCENGKYCGSEEKGTPLTGIEISLNKK